MKTAGGGVPQYLIGWPASIPRGILGWNVLVVKRCIFIIGHFPIRYRDS